MQSVTGNPKTILPAFVLAVFVAGPLHAGGDASGGNHSPQHPYAQALGIRVLEESERNSIKGRAWMGGGVLYVDLYNGNADLTLSSVDIQVIPSSGDHQESRTGVTDDLHDDTAGFYDGHIYRLTAAIPPGTGTYQHLRITDIPPGRRFTWKILHAKGYETQTPYPWHLWL